MEYKLFLYSNLKLIVQMEFIYTGYTKTEIQKLRSPNLWVRLNKVTGAEDTGSRILAT